MEIRIPTLPTERLLLRPLREDDVEPLFEIMQDPDVVRFIADRKAPTRQECWRGIAGWIGHWALRGYGLWAVEERKSGAFIGRIGLINPLDWPGPELGYMLGKPWWRLGYATEACAAALDWSFATIGFVELISLIDPDNAASIAVATRLGETLQGETDLLGHRLRVYAIRRETWERRQAMAKLPG